MTDVRLRGNGVRGYQCHGFSLSIGVLVFRYIYPVRVSRTDCGSRSGLPVTPAAGDADDDVSASVLAQLSSAATAAATSTDRHKTKPAHASTQL